MIVLVRFDEHTYIRMGHNLVDALQMMKLVVSLNKLVKTPNNTGDLRIGEIQLLIVLCFYAGTGGKRIHLAEGAVKRL